MAFACRPAISCSTSHDRSRRDDAAQGAGDRRQLCRAYGVAAVYVSHDVAVVGELANRVAVLYAGRVVEVGATADVFGAPEHPYTRGSFAPCRRRTTRGRSSAWRASRRGRGAAVGLLVRPAVSARVARCTEDRPPLLATARPDHVARCVLLAGRAAGHVAFPTEPLTDRGALAVHRARRRSRSRGSRRAIAAVP